ncbi:hypothetical protein QOZ80_4AG0317410 [Eleusine coracana subsp. coracana]|nr:hypothetical protein QOZ80_4AG0317410 [Eleusine coracana subsp. coracana]
MQYQHGASRSRMAPFARGGGAYGRGHKQFYAPPPPPPPPPLPAAPPPPQNKYEVLMEAGRLAAEYLVATGVLPPGSLQARGAGVAAGGWGQLPPPPPLPVAQEAPVYHNPRNDRGRADREYSNPNARSRRSRGGDYSGTNSSNYNRRGKRKFGADNRYSDWGRDQERGRGYSDSRSYDEDEDGAPGFRRERRGSAVADEVGSSVSGVAAEGTGSKVEVTGESELEDTGSKVSSNNNIRKNAGAAPEVEDENEANKMQEDKVSDSELVGEGNSNHVSSDVIQETERKHSPVSSDGQISDERHEDSSALNEKVEGDETWDNKAEDDLTSGAKLSLVENSSHDDAMNLLNYCNFARVPKRPRSLLAHRNTGPSQREIFVAEQVDLVSSEEVCPVANDEAVIGNSITNIQADSNCDLVCQKHDSESTACNQVTEPVTLHEKETQVETAEMIEQGDNTQRCGDQENTERSALSPPLAPSQNSLTWQVEKGIQIYNVDTPPQDEELIDQSGKGKTAVPELLPNIGAESVVTMEEQNLGQSGSFKIRDLNLVGSPDEMRNNPRLGQCSTAGCSIELQDNQQINFGTTVDKANNTSSYALLANKEVIDIEDDSPIAAGTCDTSKVKTEMIYPSMENMMNPPLNTNILQGVQDGYNIAIPDYLGADMPCYQSIQTDLQAGMGLNDSGSITVMEDSIYGSLGDIGFMGVWDQPPQDYEKFF